jgi:Mitochondrial K+-H+ exchange-related
VVAWVGRVLKTAHEYYVRIEDRIDPGERVLKTMASAERFVVYHGAAHDSTDARSQFRLLLRLRRIRQIFWFIVDLIISAVAIVFTPILAPIPGPNVVLYFPLLRMLSHYRAIRGASSGLRSVEIEFKCLPDLVGLEENLRTPPFDRRAILAVAEGLKIRGLEQFLERMV